MISLAGIVVIQRTGQDKSFYWPGWFLLELMPGSDESAVLNSLGEHHARGIISASNTQVHFMDIPELTATSINRISEKLQPGDPRYDPFLKNVASLFVHGQAPLLYLPANRSLRQYAKILERIPAASDFRLLDAIKSRYYISGLFYLSALILIIVVAGTLRRYFIAASLPWLPVVVLIGHPGAFVALIAALTTAFLFSGYHWSIAVGVLNFLLITMILFMTFSLSNAFITALSTVSGVSLAVLVRNIDGGRFSFMPIRRAMQNRKTQHVRFEPVSLYSRPQKKTQPFIGKPLLRSTALGVLCAIPFLILNNDELEHPPVPAILESVGSFDSPSALHQLQNNKNLFSLPDISDLTASVTYQHYFLNGAQFRLPLPGDVLTKRQYFDAGDSISVQDEVLVTFNDQWFEDTLALELSRSIGLLYAAAGGAAPVQKVTKPIHGYHVANFNATTRPLLFIVLFLCLMASIPELRQQINGKSHKMRAYADKGS